MAAAMPAPGWEHPLGESAPHLDPRYTEVSTLSDASTLRAAHLDPEGIERCVLTFGPVMLAPAYPGPGFGLAVTRAANNWLMDRWLADSDERLFGLLLVPNQLPDAAVEEIRRVGRNPRIVGVLMAGNGLGRPFGHPVYHPIYEAASELGLPILINVGGDFPPNTASHPTAGGWPSTFAEYYCLRAQAIMTHLVSLITQGVLERHRDLKVMVVGAGVAWIPGWLWRFDGDFRAYSARETPWLRRSPSEQVRDQVRVSTYSLASEPADATLGNFLQAVPGMEDILCYASGFPAWDANHPAEVDSRFPRAWRTRILSDNAAGFFRWPSRQLAEVS